ncbi:MAG: 1-acyl-sn-glycerol-3-phosphate acyltransferase [Clostridiales bacterium]|jgi:1-acyl-sn-glycerol-3-phosphate acyltransferase|nr:1-acyl-sn-glycerol-3-phosphate acyltransferase [Clostridiales bacterium]
MTKPGRLFRYRYLAFDIVKVLNGIPTLLIFRPKIFYENEKARKPIRGGGIIATNHKGFIDPVKIFTVIFYRRIHCMARKEIFEHSALMRLVLRMGQCIKVDPENPADTSYLAKIREYTADKRLVAIYPEGHIVKDGEDMLEFKLGTALLAASCKVPIIPVYIAPRKSIWNRMRAAIGEPLYPYSEDGKMLPMADLQKVMEDLTEKMLLLREMTK